MNIRLAVVLATSGLLAACGGGGGASSSETQPPAVVSANLTGVAYGDGPISAGVVEMKCERGSASAPLGANASFSLSLPQDSGPCVLEVTDGATGMKLHSVTVSGTVANINPASELVVARLGQTDPARFFAQFGTAGAAPSASALATSQSEVQTLLGQGGSTVDVASLMQGGFDATGKASIDAFNTRLGDADLGDLVTVAAYTPAIDDAAAVFAAPQTGLVLLPLVAAEWTPRMSANAVSAWFHLKLCGGGNIQSQCDALLSLQDVKNELQGTWDLYLQNGSLIDEFDSAAELQQAVMQGISSINRVIVTASSDPAKGKPSWDTVKAAISAAMGKNSASLESFLDGLKSEFAARGFPTSNADLVAGPASSGSAGGYRCPTSKPEFHSDWIQSHANFWAARSAHDAYVACKGTQSEAACKTLDEQEIKYCAVARKTCELLVVNKADCPG